MYLVWARGYVRIWPTKHKPQQNWEPNVKLFLIEGQHVNKLQKELISLSADISMWLVVK